MASWRVGKKGGEDVFGAQRGGGDGEAESGAEGGGRLSRHFLQPEEGRRLTHSPAVGVGDDNDKGGGNADADDDDDDDAKEDDDEDDDDNEDDDDDDDGKRDDGIDGGDAQSIEEGGPASLK